MPAPVFPLYVSSVAGRAFLRPGTNGRSYIGASRDPVDPTKFAFEPERVVPVSDDELRQYGRAYRRALADGDLRARTQAEYETQIATPAEPEHVDASEPQPKD